jgi:uncharacterized protein (TIGR02588 family)
MSKKSDQKEGGEHHSEIASFWEWSIGLLGLGLVLSVVGFLLYEASREGDSPPRIEIETGEVLRNGGSYLVKLRVANRGETPAAQVAIEGTLNQGDRTLETSTVTLGYVPAESQRDAGLFFQRDPAQYTLKLRALGYETP